MANRIEFAETNPPRFYGKSNSIGRLLNWDKAGSGAETLLECSHKKCLKRRKQRNVRQAHPCETLEKNLALTEKHPAIWDLIWGVIRLQNYSTIMDKTAKLFSFLLTFFRLWDMKAS